MDIQKAINEKIQRLQDLNKQMGEISKKIGTLQEEGRALHGAALEIRGGIEALAQLAQQDENDAKAAAEKAKGLILPDKSIVAADGKTVVADVNTPAPAAEEAPKTDAPVALEVK